MTRRKRSSMALVLALVGVSVFAGVSPASAAPPSGPPVLSIPGPLTDRVPNTVPASVDVSTPDTDTAITLDWVAVNGGTTQLDYCPGAQTFSGTTTTCTGATALAPGVYDVSAASYLLSDPFNYSGTSNVLSVEVYGVAPGDFASSPPAANNDATPTFTGTGPARGSVAVTADFGATPLCSATVLNDGTWGCATTLAVGFYEGIGLLSTDRAGGTSTDTAPDFTINAITDATLTQVDNAAAPWITDNEVPDVSGTKDLFAGLVTTEVSQSITGPWSSYCGTFLGAGVSTVWACTEPDNGLQHGDNYIQLTSKNEHGDPSPNAQQYYVKLVDTPVVLSPADNSFTNDATPLFSGTGEGTDADVVDSGSITQCSANTTSGSWSCSTPFLADGTYKFHVVVTPGSDILSQDVNFTVDTVAPVAPTITSGSTSSTDRTPTISGTGEPDATVALSVNGSPWPCVGGNPVVDAGGDWSCTLANALGVSSYPVTVTQTDRAGNASVASASITVTVLPAPVPVQATAVPTPTSSPLPIPGPTPLPFTWRLGSGLPDEVHPGDEVVLAASDLPPGLPVDAEFHSTVVALGSTSVAPDGTFSLPVTVPDDATPGLHHFVVTVWSPAGEAVVVEQAVTVVAFPKGAVERVAEASGGGSATGSYIDRNDPSSPTALTGSVPTLLDILTNPITLCFAALIALAIMLLVALPAEVLNSTIESNTGRFGGLFAAVQRGATRATQWLIRTTRTPVVASALLVLAASIIFGFVDPEFGFDLASLRLVLSVGLALFIVTFVASRITGAIVGRAWSLSSEIGMQPATLVFSALGVIIARVLDFSPGFLVGLVLGLELAHSATDLQRVRTSVIKFAVLVGLAVAAWLGYSLVIALQGDAPLDFVTGFVQDTLVGVTSEGLTAVMIALIPIAFLEGKTVFERSKRLWAVIFIVVASAFSLLVLPTAIEGQEIADLGWWVVVLVGFAVVTFGVTLVLRVTGRRPAAVAGRNEAERVR